MTTNPIGPILQGQRQLFLDDAGTARVERLTRTLHPPDKKGAVIRPDWIRGGHPEIRTAPIWDPETQRFKLWVCMVAPDAEMRTHGRSAYYESSDGLHWHAPSVRQMEDPGAREHNLVCIPFEDGGTGDVYCVVRDPHDPQPARRYKGWTFQRSRKRLVFAASPDGVAWTRLPVPPLPSEDEFNLSYDHQARRFLATVKVKGPYGRAHALSISEDFERWTEPELIFHADDTDQILAAETIRQHVADPTLRQPLGHHPADYGADIYNFPVCRYEGLYLAFPMVFYHTIRVREGRNYEGFHHIQLACSRDLRQWQRVGDRRPFIAPSPLGAGAYDLLQIVPPSYPVPRGDELWFYYTGLKHRYPPPHPPRDMSAICLATLRRDGFLSLDADQEGGVVTTHPFRWEGERLFLNGDATRGEIACELLDAAERPLPGYERSACIPLAADAVRWAVAWQGQDRLPAATVGPIRLRLHVRQAHLYSYWME